MATRNLTRREQLLGLLFVVAVTTLIARWDMLPWDAVFKRDLIPLRYEVRDLETNKLIPCKLTIIGAKGTTSPSLGLKTPGCNTDTAVCDQNRVMSVTGQGTLFLPLGTYDVFVSRGLEWKRIPVRGVDLLDKSGGDVSVLLKHEVDLRGWASADFHVHGEQSWDSKVTAQERLFQAVSDGLDIVFTADHNKLTDAWPKVHEFNLEPYVNTFVSEEITPPKNAIGHFGAIPIVPDRTRMELGPVVPAGLKPAQIFGAARQRNPNAFIIVNHPRHAGTFSYFDWGQYDPATGRAANPDFVFDFDGVEVLNASFGTSTDELDSSVRDWFSLLNRGHLVTAVGSSDSHLLHNNVAGYPRTYVNVPGNSPREVKVEDLVTALRGHHAFVSTGPFISVSAGAAGIGDMAPAVNGKVQVNLKIQAANWISVREVNVFVNGSLLRSWRVPSSTESVRFERTFELEFPRDGYFVVEATGSGTLAPTVGGDGLDLAPYALTNPIFIDADGDGKWSPPDL